MKKGEWVDVEPADVRPGDMASRISPELDPREVVEVDHDRDMVRLAIHDLTTDPIPLEFYTYRRFIPEEKSA